MNKGRKVSGGKYHANRKSKLYEKRSQENQVFLGATKRKKLVAHGGLVKYILLSTDETNVLTSKGTKKTTIKNVIETPQNKFLARRNRLMKGAVIETDLGKAKITNRPSQEGLVNSILIEG